MTMQAMTLTATMTAALVATAAIPTQAHTTTPEIDSVHIDQQESVASTQFDSIDLKRQLGDDADRFMTAMANISENFPGDVDYSEQDGNDFIVAFKGSVPDEAQQMLNQAIQVGNLDIRENTGISEADALAASEAALGLAAERWPGVEIWAEVLDDRRTVTVEVPAEILTSDGEPGRSDLALLSIGGAEVALSDFQNVTISDAPGVEESDVLGYTVEVVSNDEEDNGSANKEPAGVEISAPVVK